MSFDEFWKLRKNRPSAIARVREAANVNFDTCLLYRPNGEEAKERGISPGPGIFRNLDFFII